MIEDDTTMKSIDITKIKTELLLNKVDVLNNNSTDTSCYRQSNSNDTSTSSNNYSTINLRLYNRKINRYAKKYNISLEEAFRRLYK